MSAFDYDAAAELYSRIGAGAHNKTLEYRRFERAAEAIRHVIEYIPSHTLPSCSLDVAEEAYVGKAILQLYESPEYPLPRRAKLAQ